MFSKDEDKFRSAAHCWKFFFSQKLNFQLLFVDNVDWKSNKYLLHFNYIWLSLLNINKHLFKWNFLQISRKMKWFFLSSFLSVQNFQLTNVLAVSMNFVYQKLFSGTELLHTLNKLENYNLFSKSCCFFRYVHIVQFGK